MKKTWLKVYRTLMVTTMLLASCHPSPRSLTVVTGKTVYGDLALEAVSLEVHRWSEAGWNYYSDSRSGYHGSFRLHLAAGKYMITARTSIREGEKEVALVGDLSTLVVKEGERRIDRVVIEMRKGGQEPGVTGSDQD
jgi:hypothetical protein